MGPFAWLPRRGALDVIRHINRAARLLTKTRWFHGIASSDCTKAQPSNGPAYRLTTGFSAYGAFLFVRVTLGHKEECPRGSLLQF
jgi:hypothetical protein